MKTTFVRALLTFILSSLAETPILAATRYVDAASINPASPYTSWATAARTIQDAIDAADEGDEVMVTDGVYETGGQEFEGDNRIAVTKSLTVRSVNGPEVTVIRGYPWPDEQFHGDGVRCAYLTSGATLIGFTLTNGFAGQGGGVWCESASAVVSNCTLTGNSAFDHGGGAFGGTLIDCTLIDNSAHSGGGASESVLNNCVLTRNRAEVNGGDGGGAAGGTLNNCTITGNRALRGGGVSGSSLMNCIVYYNTAATGPNHLDSFLGYSCTTPWPSEGTGNISDEPQLASASHLSIGSPCRGAGSSDFANGTDIDGEAWANPPSMGCDEYYPGADLGPLAVTIEVNHTNVATGFAVEFIGEIDGHVGSSRWEFGDGTVISNRPYVSHAWATAGTYPVVLRAYNTDFSDGVSAVLTVHVVEPPVHHVSLTSMNPVPPFDSWATAATNIQDAIDEAGALPGTLILVSNGVYEVGGRAVYEFMTNRVAVTKPLTVRSVNGPEVTVIRGYQVPGTTNGDGAVRCAYLTHGAALSGFTLTQGATLDAGDPETAFGGGAWCESASAVLSNCVLTGNSASIGGGAYSGTLIRCSLTGNSANWGGGVAESTLSDCILTGNGARDLGGGALRTVLSDCTLANNSAWSGGATAESSLKNCTLAGNSATNGGGSYQSTLVRCHLTNNSAFGQILAWPPTGSGGAAHRGVLDSCTLIGNRALRGGGAAEATLTNCNLERNSTDVSGWGGGAYFSTLSGCHVINNAGSGVTYSTLRNCVLAENPGFGVIGSTLDNCLLTGSPTGASGSTLNNCTVVGNLELGASGSTLNNSIVYYNGTTGGGVNYRNCNFNYSCTTPLPTNGVGNISDEPQLASASHLSADSSCRGAGSAAFASGVDIDGEPWASPPSMGCDEFNPGFVTGTMMVAIKAAYTNLAAGYAVDFSGKIDGRVSASRWEFGDGTIVSNRPVVSHGWTTTGNFAVVLRAYNEEYPDGLSATVTVNVATQPVHYVSLNSANPLAPFLSWTTAATNIQDAVDAAAPGALVLVSNGVYQTGGRVAGGELTNRVVVAKPLAVRGVNGPEVTVIQGSRGNPLCDEDHDRRAVRCVFLASGAILTGFTLTNGAAWQLHNQSSRPDVDVNGGGVWCESETSILNNCLLVNNSAQECGGGVYRGTLNDCVLVRNRARFDGGGAAASTLNNCTLSRNHVQYGCDERENGADGGGAAFSTLNNCILTSNSAGDGGGASDSTLNSCILTGNSARRGSGAISCTLNNCIVYYNGTRPDEPNYVGGSFNYCCTTPLPTNGVGNITNAPLFTNLAAGDLRLASNSPCINAGQNIYVVGTVDLDGLPRIVGGTVDIGAYEFQSPQSAISYAWLQQFGLPTDGSADNIDTDGDRLNNYQEWRAGTIPTNAASALRLKPPTVTGSDLIVTWDSVLGRTYLLEASTNLASPAPFQPLAANIPGEPGTTSFIHTNVPGASQRIYRVGVEQ